MSITVAKRGSWMNLVTGERLRDAEFAERTREADHRARRLHKMVRVATERSRRSRPRYRRHGQQRRVAR